MSKKSRPRLGCGGAIIILFFVGLLVDQINQPIDNSNEEKTNPVPKQEEYEPSETLTQTSPSSESRQVPVTTSQDVNTPCGSPVGSFSSKFYVVKTDSENINIAYSYGCNDAYINQNKEAVIATFNNLEQAKNLAKDVQGWYEIQEKEVDNNLPENTVTESITENTDRGSKGNCVLPSDLDSRGRRCGKRASSVRPGGN